MKKNLIIIILAIAFVTSFSWNWIGKAKAGGDKVEETAAAINTFVGNGGLFSGASGGGGTLQLFFNSPPEQAVASLSVTITNIDNEDINYIIDP
jgi:uncharacterized membrane protein YfcA